MAKKVLIMGGTGAMGIYLVPFLRDLEYEVHVTTRSNVQQSQHSNVKWIVGNAKKMDFLKSLLSSNYDAIVDFMVYSTEEFRERVDVLLNRTKQYVFISSYRVFADLESPLIESSPRLLDVSKDTPFLSTDEYSLAKARQEDILRFGNGRNWTIVRPSITYSTNRFQFGTLEANVIMQRGLQGLPIIFPEEMLTKQTTMTWAGDAAKFIALLIGNSQALSNDFNTVSSETKTWEEVYKVYESEIGLELKIISLDKYVDIVGGEYQIKYDRMFDRIMDNTKILFATGLEAKSLVKLEAGLKKEIQKFLKNPIIKVHNYSLNGRIDRVTGTRISLSDSSAKERLKYFKNFFNF